MNGSSSDYTPRFVDGLLDELMSELSAVMVIGPRACGKTTTAARRARTIVRLDAPNVAPVRSPGRLMAVLRTLAVCTAGSPTETTLAAAAGVDVRTLRAYLDLLEDLRIIERLPAWHSNRLTRLVKSPKYHVIDPGLAAVLMGVDRMAALRNGDALGRLLETFVVAQLRPLLRLGAVQVGMTHLRDRGGDHEVDLVLETRSGDVIAIEVKAAGRVQSRDAAHLVWLRDRLEDQFRLGVVFYTGAAVVPLGDRIVALPIAAMWSPAALHSVTA